MRLNAYCDFLYDFVNSRRDLQVEQLRIRLLRSEREAVIVGRVRFWDSSLLRFQEELIERGRMTVRASYAYHYQAADGTLVFRYDNSPHYPDLATFPHHKHIGAERNETVEPAQPPSSIDVLREIEGLITTGEE